MNEPKFTPGPWDVHDGVRTSCKCLSVSGASHPIATVERGEWGDSYPSVRRMKDTGSIEGKFEAYIERIPYGEIPESEAVANARLIAAAPALYEALKAMLVMMDRGGQPRKLDEALTWRQNDEKARAMATAALALVDAPQTTEVSK